MKIKNIKLKNRNLATTKGNVEFDKDGIAEVNEEIAKMLTSIGGYTLIDGKLAAEAPKKADKEDVVKESSAEEEKQQEEQNTESEDTSEESVADIIAPMNVPQLRKYAKDNGIDLGSATKKDEITEIILAAQK